MKEKIKLAEKILEHSSYQNQKDRIEDFFEISDNILLRLIVIDSCYSTNMNRRFFAFEDMEGLINELGENINVDEFIEHVRDLKKNSKIGISKNGNSKGHGISLLTKYLYFQKKFDFPIYDSLVYTELKKQESLKGPEQPEPSKDYFETLQKLKTKHGCIFDKLDKYFWVCGKIRNGSLSLLTKDKKEYNEILEELKVLGLDKEGVKKILKELNVPYFNKKKPSENFDNLIKEKIERLNINEIENPKLKKIKELYEKIKNYKNGKI